MKVDSAYRTRQSLCAVNHTGAVGVEETPSGSNRVRAVKRRTELAPPQPGIPVDKPAGLYSGDNFVMESSSCQTLSWNVYVLECVCWNRHQCIGIDIKVLHQCTGIDMKRHTHQCTGIDINCQRERTYQLTTRNTPIGKEKIHIN